MFRFYLRTTWHIPRTQLNCRWLQPLWRYMPADRFQIDEQGVVCENFKQRFLTRRNHKVYRTKQYKIRPDFNVSLLVEILHADLLVNNFLVIAAAHPKATDHIKRKTRFVKDGINRSNTNPPIPYSPFARMCINAMPMMAYAFKPSIPSYQSAFVATSLLLTYQSYWYTFIIFS